MNKKILFLIVILISLIPLFIIYIYIGDKKFWSYSFGLLIGAYMGVFGTVMGLIVIIIRKRLVIGIFGSTMGLLILFGMMMSFLDFYKDISYFKNKDFQITEGRVDIEDDCSRSCTQVIYINGLELANLYTPIDEEKYDGERLKIYYLPHTKLIMKIMVPF